MGIPPFGGFFSKFVLFSSAIYAGPYNGWMVWLAVAGVLNSALSLYYYARVIRYMYIEESPDATPVRPPAAMTFAIAGGSPMAVVVVITELLAECLENPRPFV